MEQLIEIIKALGPSAITVALTAIFASYFVPRWQERNANRAMITERRLRAIEQTADAFVRYIIAWRRLIEFSRALEARAGEQSPSDDENQRRIAFATERNRHKEDLLAALHQSVVYFDRETFEIFEEFTRWDESHSVSTLEDLPDVSEWWAWQERIIARMKRKMEIVPGFTDVQ